MSAPSPTPALVALLRRRAGLVALVRPRPRSRFEDEPPGELRVIDEERTAPGPLPQAVAAPAAILAAPASEPTATAPRPAGQSPPVKRRGEDRAGDRRSPASPTVTAVAPGDPGMAAPSAQPGRPRRAGGEREDAGGDPRERGAAAAREAPVPLPAPVAVRAAVAAESARPAVPPAARTRAATQVPPEQRTVAAGRPATRREAERHTTAGLAQVVEVHIGRLVVDARPSEPVEARRRRQGDRSRVARPGPDLEAYLAGHDVGGPAAEGRR